MVVLMRLLVLLPTGVLPYHSDTLNPSDILSFAKQIAAAMVREREREIYLHVHVHIVAFTPSLPPSLPIGFTLWYWYSP